MKITKGTIIRTLMLVVVILNMALKQAGKDVLNVSESEIGELIENLISLAIVLVGFWKNNSFSEKAKQADAFLKDLKESEE
ncbi:phage holin [Anaerosacchariphilus polymeriproducens]|uniref:Phage holin n=1 Tax=Anaerosacchariphilus polymeriproducens TaxID=1812858 RepID=A0A371ARL8_9FIRM|nr:phage holin [Anaerosacchariphilus polymeriproducens]RDU22219.1 phage holin [Anaerosacchariphilus polymeriproducens]